MYSCSIRNFVLFWFWRQDQAGLELTASSSLYLPSAELTDMSLHTYLKESSLSFTDCEFNRCFIV